MTIPQTSILKDTVEKDHHTENKWGGWEGGKIHCVKDNLPPLAVSRECTHGAEQGRGGGGARGVGSLVTLQALNPRTCPKGLVY